MASRVYVFVNANHEPSLFNLQSPRAVMRTAKPLLQTRSALLTFEPDTLLLVSLAQRADT